MDAQQQALLTLVRSGLTGEALSLPEQFDAKQLYRQLNRHQLLAVGYLGAVNCGLNKDSSLVTYLFQAYCQCLRHSARQQALIDAACAAFDRAGVDYMPLKGSNLRGMYPSPELRSMGDADILIRVEQYERIRPLLQELGFSEKAESDHELVWRKDNLMLELHKRLIPSYNRDYFRYFGDGWQLATVQNGTRWSMRQEDELVYLFTHFAKHYRDGGIGLRHLADLWVFLKACPTLDLAAVKRELKKLRLLEFYENVIKTVDAWFGEGQWDEKTRCIANQVCTSGSYGTAADHNLSTIIKDAGEGKDLARSRRAWVGRLVFQPYGEMKKKYPILERVPVLLPVFWVVRIVSVALFRRDRMRIFRNSNTHAVDAFRKELNLVGLKFDFEE